MTQTKLQQNNQVRINGGQWRGRKLNFPPLPGLRPTSDKIRETLFNWLRSDITGAKCLDLYAGSGALGLEALSRNADSVVFVDSSKKVITGINQNLKMLSATQGQCHCEEALPFLRDYRQGAFDIVFLDPPFNLALLNECVTALRNSQCLKKGSLIYIESEKKYNVVEQDYWLALREKQSGNVRHGLYEMSD